MNQDATNPGDPSYESGLRSENLLVGSGPTHSRFTEFVCWCAILSTSLFIVYFQYVNSKPQPGDAVKVDTTTFELLSKMLFSIRKLSPAESQTED